MIGEELIPREGILIITFGSAQGIAFDNSIAIPVDHAVDRTLSLKKIKQIPGGEVEQNSVEKAVLLQPLFPSLHQQIAGTHNHSVRQELLDFLHKRKILLIRH